MNDQNGRLVSRPTEVERVAELHAYRILDTEPEPAFDGLVRLAAVIAGVPTALIGLIDENRNWYKAKLGVEGFESDRKSSFCDRIVLDSVEVISPDTTLDPRFADHPAVTAEGGVRFYAGFPLETSSGAVLGTLCVVDVLPHELSQEQLGLLRTLAALVMTQLQLRRELLEREAQLRERHQLSIQLEEAQRVAEVGSFAFDLSTEKVTWSREMKRIFGTDPATFLPTLDSYQQLIHPDDRDAVAARVAEAISTAGSYQVEHRLIRPDGEERILLGRGRLELDGKGTPIRLSGTCQDVTEARRTAVQLRQARDLFAQVLGAATEQSIIATDLEGIITVFNRGAERMLGYDAAEMVGTNRSVTTIHDLDQLAVRAAEMGLDAGVEVFFQPGLSGVPQAREWTYIRKDGSQFVVQLTVTPMRGADDQITGHIAIATDVTQRRRAQQDIEEAVLAMALARDAAIASTNAKSAFLATMSHEIRTPMNAVIGMTGLLLDTRLDPEQRDLLETVRASGDQLLAIINDILDFSKIESGDLELEDHPFELRECVEGTIASFAGAAGSLDLISDLDDDCPPTVVGDVTRLRQVLGNLVSNAVKFTTHGDVLLRVRLEPSEFGQRPDDNRNNGRDDGRVRLRFSVADTGIGISPKSLDRLFKSFSQVDASTTRVYGGTGLGLAISKAIVEAMGGDLTVASQPGVGSEFGFTVALGRLDGVQPSLPQPAATLSGRRALIVDDNDTNRRILRLQLERQGMACTDTASPVEARALLEGGSRFEVAILDLAMPVMNGVQLATALRQLPGGRLLPLVLLSSIGRRERSDEQLFAAVLTKPTRSAALIETLVEVLSPQSVPVPVPVPAVQQAPADRAEAPAGGTLRILLAEDNEINQKVGRLMLAKLGHQVDIVENGHDALAAACRTSYDVILMDMHMPVMDGIEATRRIRAELLPGDQPRIIAMTASVTTQDRTACTEAGMDDYLAKPVRAADLSAALSDVPVRTPQPHP